MNPLNFFINYFSSVKAELRKISWPSRQETVRYSVLVIAVSLAVAIFFAALDLGLGKVVDAALALKQNNAVPTVPVTPAEQTPPGLDITSVETVPTDGSTGGGVIINSTDTGFTIPAK